MTAYYLLVFAPFLAFILDKKHRGKAFLGIFFIILFLLLAVRDISVGVDLKAYIQYFNQFSKQNILELLQKDREIGYALLNKVVALFGGNYQAFLAVVALLTTFPFWLLYKEESGNYAILIMALFLAIFPFSMIFSGLRQSIAMGLAVPAYMATRKHNFLAFIFTVVVAYTFHESAFIIFLIYPVYHLKVKPSWLWVLLPFMLLVLLFNEQIYMLILSLMGGRYADRYMEIVQTDAYTMILLFMVFMAFCFIIPDERKLDDETKGLRGILCLVALIQLFAPINQIVMRINYYFIVFIPLLIPKIIKGAKAELSSLAKLANFVMCAFFIAYFFLGAYTGADTLEIFPYIPLWGN